MLYCVIPASLKIKQYVCDVALLLLWATNMAVINPVLATPQIHVLHNDLSAEGIRSIQLLLLGNGYSGKPFQMG